MKKIKVFVVEDHPMFRDGLIKNLQDIPKIKVVGQAANGQEFLQCMEQMGDDFPDVVFMDIQMPEMGGIKTTEIACRQYKDLKIIILTVHDEDTYIEHMKHLGAKGFMNKMIYPDELEEAIHDALENKFYVSKSLSTPSNSKVTKDKADTPHAITKKETEVHKPVNMPGKIAIPSMKSFKIITIANIIRIKAEKSCATIYYYENGKVEEIVATKCMKTIMALLNEIPLFKPHRSHVINMDYVDEYIKSDGGYVLMKDKSTVTVSRNNKNELIELLKKKSP